ncbi:MAG: serine/threonine-protein phosphatase [Lachnospiraceae bacterium]|nr:serine/threonine-protein phosphatase [Lachnospiraceae bacterium]
MKDINRIVTAVYSDKGTSRDNNEDNMFAGWHDMINYRSADHYTSFYVDEYRDSLYMAAVLDGMGGMEFGEIASKASAEQIGSFYEKLSAMSDWTCEDLPEMLSDLKIRMEQAIAEKMKKIADKASDDDQPISENASDEIPGSTCCGFIMKDGKLIPFWIGDSRLYLLRSGRLILLTKDHTIAQEKVDYGIISQEEAKTVSGWHFVTAYIGDGQSSFAIGEAFDIEPGDKYLLCTDGISDRFPAQTLADHMAGSPEAFIKMIGEEIEKYSEDNATAIMVQIVSARQAEEEEVSDIASVIKKRAGEYLRGFRDMFPKK